MALATLVWFDPGITTGMAVVSIDVRWLEGTLPPEWPALGKAIKFRWFAQVGRESKALDGEGRARIVTAGSPIVSPGNRVGFSPALIDVPETLRTELWAVNECVALLDTWDKAAWGYERFIVQERNGHADYVSPVRVSSALQFAEHRYQRRRLPFVQMPQEAKTTATDELLQQAKLHTPGLRHGNDAARHCALFLRKARIRPALRAQAWPKLFGG